MSFGVPLLIFTAYSREYAYYLLRNTDVVNSEINSNKYHSGCKPPFKVILKLAFMKNQGS
jgi:hypothetical protein